MQISARCPPSPRGLCDRRGGCLLSDAPVLHRGLQDAPLDPALRRGTPSENGTNTAQTPTGKRSRAGWTTARYRGHPFGTDPSRRTVRTARQLSRGHLSETDPNHVPTFLRTIPTWTSECRACGTTTTDSRSPLGTPFSTCPRRRTPPWRMWADRRP